MLRGRAARPQSMRPWMSSARSAPFLAQGIRAQAASLLRVDARRRVVRTRGQVLPGGGEARNLRTVFCPLLALVFAKT